MDMSLRTIKGRFRAINGVDESHRCCSCDFCRHVYVGKRLVYKCEKLGLTNSRATDIRMRDPACLQFIPKGGG